MCDDVVLTYTERPRTGSRADLSSLDAIPFPVAYPLWFTYAEELDTHSRLWNAVFAAQQAIRVTGLLLLADYLACETPSTRVNEAVSRLRLPHWTDWTRLCTTLAAFWRGELPKEKPDRPPSFPRLLDAWAAVNGKAVSERDDLRVLVDGLPGNEGPARSLNDAMARRRNTLAHGAATRTPSSGPGVEEIARYAAVASAMARTLFADGVLTIVRKVPNGRFVRLSGAHPDLRFSSEESPGPLDDALARTGVAVLRGDEVPLPLYPLFLAEGGSTYDESGGITEPVMMVDEIRRHHVVRVGVLASRIDTEHVHALREALARKEAALGLTAEEVAPWTVAAWARASLRERLAEVEATGGALDLCVPRSGVDERAFAYDEPGRALLLVGDRGSGRTSLLGRIALGLVGNAEGRGSAPNDVVVLLGGGSLEHTGDLEAHLRDALLEQLGVRAGSYPSIRALLADLHRKVNDDTIAGRRLWVLIDDLEAHPCLPELAAIVRDLALEARRYPWLRIVSTLQTGSQRVLFARDARSGVAVLDLDGVWVESDGRPFVHLRPLGTDEIEHAVELWARQRGVQAPALEGLPRPLRERIATPWHLRLFLESTADPTGAPPMTEDDLLDRHLATVTRQRPAARATMSAVALGFLRSGRCVLLLEEAEAMIDRWREEDPEARHDLRRALDPLEELVTAGLLIKPTIFGSVDGKRTHGYVFAHPGFCRRALVHALWSPFAHGAIPTADDVDGMLELLARDQGPVAPDIGDALATVGARLGREAGDDVLERLAARCARPLTEIVLANALVARASRAAPALEDVVALAGKLARVAGRERETQRAWVGTLAAAARVAMASSVPVTRLFAELLDGSASVEEGEAAATFRRALGELEQIADDGVRAATEGGTVADPRALADGDASSSPPSRSVPKPQGEARRLRNAKSLRSKGERAFRDRDAAEARRLYETALAELRGMAEETPEVLDEWARVACLLANVEHAEGHALVARDLHLSSIAKLLEAAAASKETLTSPILRCYAQLRNQTQNRRLRAIYLGRMRAVLKVAPRGGLDGLFASTIDALTRGKEEHTTPPLSSIRCGRCGFQPQKTSVWSCSCGHTWNTFLTGGICPRCEHVWTTTTCLACKQTSEHSAWYGET